MASTNSSAYEDGSEDLISAGCGSPSTASGYNTPTPYILGNSNQKPVKPDRKPSNFCYGGDAPHFGFIGTQIIGFLRGLIDRLELFELLPNADLSEEPCIRFELEEAEENLPHFITKVLQDATRMHTILQPRSKVSKFSMETKWLKHIFQEALDEIIESGTFEALLDICDAEEEREMLTPIQIQHEKDLRNEMKLLHDQMEIEEERDIQDQQQRIKTLQRLEKELKKTQRDGTISLNYKIEDAVARSDFGRKKRLKKGDAMKARLEKLKEDVEDEKGVSVFAQEFLKKQNMTLREEAIVLAADHDLDVGQLDSMLKRMKDKKWEREQLCTVLEQRYVQHKSESEVTAANEESQRLAHLANKGIEQMREKSTLKLQSVWRGHLARVFVKKEKRRLKKKLAKDAKNKSKMKGKGKKK